MYFYQVIHIGFDEYMTIVHINFLSLYYMFSLLQVHVSLYFSENFTYLMKLIEKLLQHELLFLYIFWSTFHAMRCWCSIVENC